MNDYLTIRERRISVRALWGALGVMGVVVPVVVGPLAVLMFLIPPLIAVLLGGLVWFGWRVRGSAHARRLRGWIFAAWVIVTSLWLLVVTGVSYPPGSDLPEGPALVVTVGAYWILALAGSVAIAVGAYEFARRQLAPGSRPT